MTEPMTMEGFDFCFDPAACRSCGGRCCRGESGHIWVNAAEIERIAAYLRMSTVDFMAASLHRVDGRLTIRERKTKKDYLCLFFEEQTSRCAIYEVRPLQCRQFPFWDGFKGCRDRVMRECPGIRPYAEAAGLQNGHDEEMPGCPGE